MHLGHRGSKVHIQAAAQWLKARQHGGKAQLHRFQTCCSGGGAAAVFLQRRLQMSTAIVYARNESGGAAKCRVVVVALPHEARFQSCPTGRNGILQAQVISFRVLLRDFGPAQE